MTSPFIIARLRYEYEKNLSLRGIGREYIDTRARLLQISRLLEKLQQIYGVTITCKALDFPYNHRITFEDLAPISTVVDIYFVFKTPPENSLRHTSTRHLKY